MRVLLAILAWWVMVGSVIGAASSVWGAFLVMRNEGLVGSELAARLFYIVINASFSIVVGLALGLGLLFLLHVDKRLRLGSAALETR